MADGLGLKMGTCSSCEREMRSASPKGDVQPRGQGPQTQAMEKNPACKHAKHMLEGEFPLQPQGCSQILRGLPTCIALSIEDY